MALRMAITATPTSPNTASHILASPAAESASIATLTMMENQMFSYTTFMVLRAMRLARGRPLRSSFISTMSAASIAASLPTPPMAMPMSERMSTGASLMPSPTKHTAPDFFLLEDSSFSTSSTLFCGRREALKSVTPTSSATLAAMRSLSPVSMTVLQPMALSAPATSFASGLISSATSIEPMNFPFSAT